MATTTLTTTGLSFDLDAYEELLASLLEDGYEFRGFADRDLDPGEIVLRHDVDLSPDRALEMARLEADFGVTSTYCFLLTTPIYDLAEPGTTDAVREIASVGHDVGLHFDTRHYWDDEPPDSDLVESVSTERAILERLIDGPVSVVSPHVPPEWILGREYDGFENAYQPRFFTEVAYVSDSNQKWRSTPPFPDGRPEAAQVLVHPGLWGESDRPMDEIVDELASRTRRRVAEYVAPLGE